MNILISTVLKFCSYCKKGHIIKECQIRPPRRNATAFTATVGSSTTPVFVDQNLPASMPTLTPEMVQQIIISTFSALGLWGKASLPSSSWYFDSSTSNHMTNNVVALTNVTNYSGNLQRHPADGNNIPITAIGDTSSSLTNVYVFLDLTNNLISVGQLVDNDCKVEFSKSGCLVQDQHSWKMITKGPKVGCLFPLYSSLSPSFLPFISSNSATVNFQLLHKHLGHPNSNVLHDLWNPKLSAINIPHLLVLFNLIAILVNLVKVKFYHFQFINQM